MSATKTSSGRKAMIGGMLGNGLEWYDYALYGYMSLIFSRIFFPPETDPSLSLILTYLTFAVGFISRPLGAVLFGRIGDKYGRKKALIGALIMMAIPTGCIGLLPTYEMIGMAAPILLLCIRIMQGLSLGGAFGGSISYVVEHAPADKRGAVGSVVNMSLVIGFLLGSIVSTVVASLLPVEDFESWGWRLPFVSGVAIAFVGYYLRQHGDESPVYEQAKKDGHLSKSPVKDAFMVHPWKMLQGFSVYMFVTVPFYLLAIYMISYNKNYLGQDESDALLINSFAMLSMFVPMWMAARWSDRVGRKRVMIGSIISMLVVVYPCFMLMQGGDFYTIVACQCVMAAILGWYLAPIPAMLVELFPTAIRYTGMSLAYNFCAIIGGFTPSASEFLISSTGSPTAIMYLVMASGAVSLAMLIPYKDPWKEPLK
jgi:MHS family proline/betaine transporter-like MFS transporter